VVGRHGDPGAPGGGDEVGGVLDRLGAPLLGALLPGASPGAVDGGTRGPELDGDATAGTARGAGDERDAPGQIGHGDTIAPGSDNVPL